MIKTFITCLCLIAGLLSAEELLKFDASNFKLLGQKTPGLELLKPVLPNRKAVILRWGNPPPSIFLYNVSSKTPKIGKFEEAIFTLNIEVPEPLQLGRIVIRVEDATGETFQFHNKIKGRFSGKMKLNYRVADDGSAESCWGGNKNKKFDWPIKFSQVAVDSSRKTIPEAKIIFESVEYKKSGENISVSIETGHRLNLLLPKYKESPGLLVKNEGTEDVVLGGILHIENTAGEVSKAGVSISIPMGKQRHILIPGDYSKNGWWKIKYRLISGAGKEYCGEHRFARMIPAGPTAGRAQEFLFGVCSHLDRMDGEKPELEAMAAGLCGAKIMRFDFEWAKIQPEQTRWLFSKYDKIIELLAKNGIEPQATLGFSVRWAVDPDHPMKNPKLKGPKFVYPKFYADFCGRIAERYKGKIRYFELWNEPDLANFDFPKYIELMTAGYNSIKKSVPESKVMNGGVASIYTDSRNAPGDNSGWVKYMKKDAGKHFDLFAYHAHGNLESYLNQIELLEQRGLIGSKAPRPWYSNETAISSVYGGEIEQAVTLFKKFLTSWAHGAVGYNWYLLRDKGEYHPLGHVERHFGLLTTEFEPKPAYITYNMLSKNYLNGKYLGTVHTYPDITIYRFIGRNGEKLAAVWNNVRDRSQTLFATLPPGTVKVDLFGDEVPIKLHDGFACISVDSMPFTLKAPAGSREGILFEKSFLQSNAAVQFILEPGKARKITIPLNNPMKKDLSLTIKATPPEGISISPAMKTFLLKSGEKINAEFTIHAAPNFSAKPTSPKKMQIDLLLGNICVEKMNFAFVCKTTAGEPLFLLNRQEQYNSLVPSAPENEPLYWKGITDLSAKIYLYRKQNVLCLKVDVTDDCHIQPYTTETIWKGDSIQIGLAIPKQNGVWRLGFARLENGKSEVFCWNRPVGFSDPSKSIHLKTVRDEKMKRTIYEASIPCSALGLNQEILSKGIRFNLIINDNDGRMREGFLAVAPGMGIIEDTSRWIVVNFD